MKKIIIIGNGGHSKVVRDIINQIKEYKIIAILDEMFDSLAYENELYTGPVSRIHDIYNKCEQSLVVIAIGNNRIRKEIVDKLKLPDHAYATLLHPSVILGSNVTIGQGTVVMPGSIINAAAIISEHCIINTSVVIEHDAFIEPFVHLSPKVGVAGNVRIREGSHIGIGANIIPNITIEEWCTIGAGSTVIHPLPAYCTAVGLPAKPIKMNTN